MRASFLSRSGVVAREATRPGRFIILAGQEENTRNGRPHRRLLARHPAQVIIKQGRKTAKRELSLRFTEAIDMCAMRTGAAETDDYLA